MKLYSSIETISIQQTRIANMVQDLSIHSGSISNTFIGSSGRNSIHTTSHTGSSSSSGQTTFKFHHKSAKNSVHSDDDTEVIEINQLPSFDSQNISSFTIEALHSDDTQFITDDNSDLSRDAGTIKIIEVPSSNVNEIVKNLIERNRWLHLKYFRIGKLYQTASSFTNSFNCIATLDLKVHQACIEQGKLVFPRIICKLYNYTAISPCRKMPISLSYRARLFKSSYLQNMC